MKATLQKLGVCVLILTTSLPLVAARQFQESGPIRLLSSYADNNFPDSLTFNISAEADSPITSVSLYYYTLGDISATRQPVEITPGTHVSGAYTWDTSRITVPPSAPVFFYWEVDDEAGNELTTEEQLFPYDDLRFPWNEVSDDEIVVRWYEGDQDFGNFVYQTARRALDQMKAQSGSGLDFPIYILLYANHDDFSSWHFYVDEWVGGQAFTPMGITTQIIGSNASRSWIEDVIPHEIAHLFLYQATDTGMGDWPTWVNEGLAMYYEFGANEDYLALAADAARRGTFLPLGSLSGGFGRDPDQVHLAYGESFSAVLFLLETWGDEALQSLIGSFRLGTGQREALELATGVTWEEFTAQWFMWMGVPATPAAPPTPTQGLVFPTTPSGWPTVTPFSRTPTPVASLTPEPAPVSPTATQEDQGGFKLPVCGGLIGVLMLPGLSLVARRRRRTAGDQDQQP
jgi:hypothetical protein